MKKTMFFAAIAAVAMLSACQKEAIIEQEAQFDELVFTAAILDQSTKTTINTDASSENKGKVSWEVGDSIYVTADTTNMAVYYIKEESDIAGDGSATFTYKSGEKPSAEADKYFALYGDPIFSGQTYSATAGKLPMIGESDSSNKTKLNFTVACGLLKLNLTALDSETDKTISKIEVTGTPTEGFNPYKRTYTLTCNAETGESIELAKDFYIALPAGSYDEMLFYNKSGFVCQKSAKTAMEIVDNKVQPVTLTGIAFNLLPGKFSVSDTMQVRFTKGNLYYSTTDSKFHIEPAQNVTYATLEQSAYDATHVCHFFWSNITDWQTSGKEPWASSYSYSERTTTDKFFCGEDNKITVDGQSGLYALTGDSDGEWNYLFNSRTNASSLYKYGVSVTIGDNTVANCVVIAPDDWDSKDPLKTSYSATEWATAEAAGLVCLPAVGYREGSSLNYGGLYGGYWSASPLESNVDGAHDLLCSNYGVDPDNVFDRFYGGSVRLVSSVSK